jgi:hypothetical protein
MNFSFSTNFRCAIWRKKGIFRNFLDHNAQKWLRKVNPHTWDITTPKVGETDVEIKILKTDAVCLLRGSKKQKSNYVK